MAARKAAHKKGLEISIVRVVISHISKRFGGVCALQNVSLSLEGGEVVALLGENGAGKSTLVHILAGALQLDEGSIKLDGEDVSFASVQEALSKGIYLVHQELCLCDNLDVGSNIFLGREPRRHGFIDRKTIAADAALLLSELGLACSPMTPVQQLSVAQKQLVEIAKALSGNVRILILDEPTSSLTPREAAKLFALVRDLKKKGVGIIYISHRLAEIEEIADRVVVLKDGQVSGSLERNEFSMSRMVSLMVGRNISPAPMETRSPRTAPILEVRGLRTTAYPRRPFGCTIGKGEVVGLAGLMGSGRTEILETLFGLRKGRVKELKIDGRMVRVTSPHEAVRAGLALVPEDRKEHGAILDMSIAENIALPNLFRLHPRGLIRGQAALVTAQALMQKIGVKAETPTAAVRNLSGGNQQKVVLAKWIGMEPSVLLLDEPTRGIDVGAKEEIYKLIHALAARGMGVLYASSEMEEHFAIADRVLVIHEGKVAGELRRDELTEERIVALGCGHVKEPANVAGEI